ncbi:MAG: GGDEF domain-containing protein [Isosphaeraceae bacterium]
MTRRRLETLRTMAVCALGRTDQREADETSPRQAPPELPSDHRAELCREFSPGEPGGRTPEFSTPVLQGATFLGAVLPFALGQARRHGEPLALLCVAVDRLSGIRELLGSEVSSRAVRNVGTHLAAQLRSSDIVARIDDDRIIVVLPRARIQGALFVAQKICRSVETTPCLLPELPCLTVSIGVAEYPASADSVEALLDSADSALGQAKAQGKNRAVAAPIRSAPDRQDRPCLAS